MWYAMFRLFSIGFCSVALSVFNVPPFLFSRDVVCFCLWVAHLHCCKSDTTSHALCSITTHTHTPRTTFYIHIHISPQPHTYTHEERGGCLHSFLTLDDDGTEQEQNRQCLGSVTFLDFRFRIDSFDFDYWWRFFFFFFSCFLCFMMFYFDVMLLLLWITTMT